MKYNLLTGLLILLASGTEIISAQETEPVQDKSLFIKGNALFAPIGILNVGLEKQLNSRYTIQGDVFISPWKSFAGHELQYYSASAEGRYYFKEAFKHWYVGANLAFAVYNVQKWNYWNDSLHINDNGDTYINSNLYQRGFSIMLGVTAGYQFQLSDRWNLDIYGTVGTSQGFYKGYDRTTGKRYDQASGLNKSGEIIPYRGGIMISYKLK
ncbi:hypothetical protein DRF59_05785 [Chryseobacterium flavum]|uniref:DUF3575 domain-containing protein n=1 Tax=Chryseobacterium flavum TaxID=415851 RepID=A0A3D9CPZ7_9FLAO|nr:DUF3575 domain-containing protein [Chryseobacterium flavum]REC67842.1 hypothetical protein DRF59_05785 [Chryseobacterium flavum]